MKNYNINKPIGLDTICKEIENTCLNSHRYVNCGLKPNHLIVPLAPGEGHTILIEYITDMYKVHNILGFSNGLDDYIEITLDGTLQQLRQSFLTINSAAIYANQYSGVIGIDISELASHMNETQFSEFLCEMKVVCNSAYVVFFISTVQTKNEIRMVEKIQESIGNFKYINASPYSKEDLCAFLERSILEKGIEIKYLSNFRECLIDVIEHFNVITIKGATNLVNSIIFYADFSEFTPSISKENIKVLLN